MKLLLVSTSGGHFATMRALESFWSKHDRVWVTHLSANTEVLATWQEKVHWLPYQAPRDLRAFLLNLPATFQLIRKESPDLVISTGASVAVNFAIASKILGKRFIYVESVSRSQDLSLSGKLIYPFCDEMYVQWPQLCQRYPKAAFRGYAG